MILKFTAKYGKYQPGSEYKIVDTFENHIFFVDTNGNHDIIRTKDGKVIHPDTLEEVAVVNLPSISVS